jgi:prevent-host-death family protein
MATLAIELAEAETQLTKLIEDLQANGEILITRNGEPLALLVSAHPVPADRVPGTARGMFTVPDDFDAPLEEFRDYA